MAKEDYTFSIAASATDKGHLVMAGRGKKILMAEDFAEFTDGEWDCLVALVTDVCEAFKKEIIRRDPDGRREFKGKC